MKDAPQQTTKATGRADRFMEGLAWAIVMIFAVAVALLLLLILIVALPLYLSDGELISGPGQC